MCQDSKYRVVLLDQDGCEITERPADNNRQAKMEMRYLLSDDYATAIDSNHRVMGTFKAEVRNRKGECLSDQVFQQVA